MYGYQDNHVKGHNEHIHSLMIPYNISDHHVHIEANDNGLD